MPTWYNKSMNAPPVLDVSFGPLYDSADNGGLSAGDIEQLVDADIDAFDEHFQGLGNEPLVKAERAIVKTYLAYKLFKP
jgi:hypothetical protein